MSVYDFEKESVGIEFKNLLFLNKPETILFPPRSDNSFFFSSNLLLTFSFDLLIILFIFGTLLMFGLVDVSYGGLDGSNCCK